MDAELDPNIKSKQNDTPKVTDILVAATLINNAAAGRNIEFRREEKRIKSYAIYNHFLFKVTLNVCLWVNLLLALCEKPAVSILALPYWATMTIEAICVMFFALRLGHSCYFQVTKTFWRDPKNLTILVTILLTLTDMICYNIWYNSDTSATVIRWSRPLRPLFIINMPEGRQLRKAIRNMRRTLPDILHIMILFFANIALFALLCLKLFEQRQLTYPDGSPYFQNYWDSFWDLYVLVTTANNPDVKMPAYDASDWYVTIFVVYVIINLYVIMNIVLAVIYNNYKRHLKDEVRTTVHRKHSFLSQAFDLIKCDDTVTKEMFHDVMTKVDSTKTTTQVDLLFKVLNTSPDDCIDKRNFLKLADLLAINLRVKKEEATLFDRKCPPCYQSKINEIIKVAICTKYFRWFFDFLIVVNAVCIGLKLDEAEWYFLPAFTLEIVLQLYAQGPAKYFRIFWNIFDFIVISAALIVTIAGSIANKENTRLEIVDLIMVVRILRLVRIASISSRFQIILTTLVNIGPSIATYGCVIFVVFYIYAIVGMEIFHDRVRYYDYDNTTNASSCCCGNPALNGSKFAYYKYCNNNFNNFIHSLILLFDLLIVNQWHVLAEGYVLVTHKAARLYFISFHIISVIVLLNIFTAFIIEAFILEYTSSKSHLEGVVERRIKELGLGSGQKHSRQLNAKQDKLELVENIEADDTSSPDVSHSREGDLHSVNNEESELRFSLKTSGCKRLESLLQLMFENELYDDEQQKGQETKVEVSGHTD